MQTRAFGIDFQSNTPEFTAALREKVQRRLEKLAKAQRIGGATVAIHSESDAQPREYRVRIALQTKAKSPTVIEKGNAVPAILSKALDAVERQVRDQQDRRRTARRNPPEIYRA